MKTEWIDGAIIARSLKEEELAFLTKLNLHDVRKSLARLKVDKIVKT